MPPSLKKWELIGFSLSVRASVCQSVQKEFLVRVLKFHIMDSSKKKITNPLFFCLNYFLLWLLIMPLFEGHAE